ncbi:acyl-CoA dehydrogenase family protein [Streptomyces sp. CAU 1734]|uniref:acyl-CoA dehydrogenase family protein n=1 Tax=Streptomyces sp. CAU 1734 TaxID=3140360 RepID=UPI00326012B6
MVSDNGALKAADGVLPLLRKQAAQVDSSAAFPEAGMGALAGSGLFGLLIPTSHGGMGRDLRDLVDVAQVLAGGCLSTAMIWAMHCQQTDVLVRFAPASLLDRLLPRIARGDVYVASVTTEHGTGGHLLTGVAPLRQADTGLRLDREAPVVTGGEYAQGFLITMRSSEDSSQHRVSLVYADRDQLEIEPRGGWDTLGMRGTRSVGLKLSGVVPESQLVGEPGGFRSIAVESMAPVGHLAWAACWLGAARAALADLVGLFHSGDRPRGANVASELTAERLARIRMELELVGAYLHRVRDEVVALRSEGGTLSATPTQIHLNTLKVAAAELTYSAVDRMVQLAGVSVGYRRGAAIPLERHLRDLRSASLNYSNDRLLTANGALTLLDRTVRLA